jgi:glucose/arabinose dehydrogenase
MSLTRVTFDGKGGATPAERWGLGHRLRDIEEAPDGALWLLVDSPKGGVYRLTPK